MVVRYVVKKRKTRFARVSFERPTGVEPASRAWEARVIPVYDGRNFNVLLPATLKLRKPSCCSGSAEGRRGFRCAAVAVRRSQLKLVAYRDQHCGNHRAAPALAEGRRGPRMQKLYRSQAYEVKARGSALDPSPWSSHGSVQEVMHGAATKPKAAVGTFKKPFQQSSMQ